jgi:hypothetical protein
MVWKNISLCLPGDSEAHRETPVRTDGILGEIRTGHLLDKSHSLYLPSQPAWLGAITHTPTVLIMEYGEPSRGFH